MPQNTGTLGLADLLAQTYVSAESYGVMTVQQVIERDVAAYNGIWRPIMSDFVAITTDALRVSGGSSQGRMQKVNQAGRAPTQKQGAGGTVGFPLDKFQYNIGWTADYFELATPADMAQQNLNAQGAHAQALTTEFKRAIFPSANYNYVDEYNKGITIGIKRFANADGQPIPNGPNGETFDGTSHNHYLASATLTAGALTSLVSTVQEHNSSAAVIIAINTADEAAVRAVTGFIPLVDSRLSISANANQPIERLNVAPANNKPIGFFGAATVWLKPWAIADYAVALDLNAPEKPVAMRELRAGKADLRIAAQFAAYPLTAEYMEAMFGMGVWGRIRGAVLQFSNASYQDPTIS